MLNKITWYRLQLVCVCVLTLVAVMIMGISIFGLAMGIMSMDGIVDHETVSMTFVSGGGLYASLLALLYLLDRRNIIRLDMMIYEYCKEGRGEVQSAS